MTVGGRRVKQINNLLLRHGMDGLFRVYAPDGRCLEEFGYQIDAERWMRQLHDFRKRHIKKPGTCGLI